MFSWGMGLGVTGMVSILTGRMLNDLSHAALGLENPKRENAQEKRRERLRALKMEYGEWAVETAVAVCPRGDIGCIEREARRLLESRIYRR
jgi:hypothetical protein